MISKGNHVKLAICFVLLVIREEAKKSCFSFNVLQ